MAAVREMCQRCKQGSISSPNVQDQILHKKEPAGKCKAAKLQLIRHVHATTCSTYARQVPEAFQLWHHTFTAFADFCSTLL